MNKQHFTDFNEAEAFVENLYKENKWIIRASRGADDEGGYNVEWQEHKKYVALDDKEYPDEIWITEKGEMILIQDLSEAHVRNVVRMLLRNERLQKESYYGLPNNLRAAIMSGDTGQEFTEPTAESATADNTEDAFTLPDNVFAVKGNTTLN